MKKKKAYVAGYCIQEPNGTILINTIRWQKKWCIKDFISGYLPNWKDYGSYGWKCVKVSVSKL